MADNDKLVRFESEIRPLAGGSVLHTPVDEFTVPEVVEAYAVVKFLEDKVGERRKALRERILRDDVILKNAKPSKTGGGSTKIGGHKVTRKKATSYYANVDKIRQVLMDKGMTEDEVFDDKIITSVVKVVNVSKMERLVSLGKLSAEEVEAFHKVTWTVIVDPSDDLEQILESAERRLAAAQSQVLALPSDDE